MYAHVAFKRMPRVCIITLESTSLCLNHRGLPYLFPAVVALHFFTLRKRAPNFSGGIGRDRVVEI